MPTANSAALLLIKGRFKALPSGIPVITSDGLIGVIEEVGLTYSRVITLHDPSLNVGAYVSRTRDTGIVVGAVDLAQDGQCKMTYLPRDSGAAIGDMILTSGGNVFPKGLKIGTIKETAGKPWRFPLCGNRTICVCGRCQGCFCDYLL